jgi:hypothetical protein
MWPGRIGILQVKANGVGEAAIYTNSMATKQNAFWWNDGHIQHPSMGIYQPRAWLKSLAQWGLSCGASCSCIGKGVPATELPAVDHCRLLTMGKINTIDRAVESLDRICCKDHSDRLRIFSAG